MNFQPLRRSSLYLEIVEQIEDLIMGERLQPGERLPTERKLAEMFDVSRTTVRQALAALEAKGLIHSQIGSGTYTRERSTEFAVARLAHMLDRERLRLAEAFEARRILEPAVAQLAAERATDEDLEEIASELARMEAAVGAEVTEHDSSFHLAIGRAAKNRIVRTVLDALTEATRASRGWALSDPADRKASLADHHRIYEAIASRNGNAAASAMAQHINNVSQLAANRMDKRSAGAIQDHEPSTVDSDTLVGANAQSTERA